MSEINQFNKMDYPQYIIDQFWDKVDYPGNDQDCWEWTAGKDRDGYGRFRSRNAQRFVWEFFNGEIPHGMKIRTICGNRSCCNPNHLKLIPIKNTDEMFWNRINYPGNDQDCWEWTDSLDKDGYGKYRGRGAHITAWEFVHEKVKKGEYVLHKCDNRKCCNPAHLFLGTNQENTQDRHKKGRSAKGSQIGTSKLTEQIVIEILNKIQSNQLLSIHQILEAYPIVSGGTIRKILDGIYWQHITKNYKIKELRDKVIAH